MTIPIFFDAAKFCFGATFEFRFFCGIIDSHQKWRSLRQQKNRTSKVAPKETKWRLAYKYKTTIKLLDSLNPEIKAGLKIGQTVRIPKTQITQTIPEKDSLYNYYKVLPKEGFYRIKKKLGVDQVILDSLNPDLKKTGLFAGMILKIPGEKTGGSGTQAFEPVASRRLKTVATWPGRPNEQLFASAIDRPPPPCCPRLSRAR